MGLYNKYDGNKLSKNSRFAHRQNTDTAQGVQIQNLDMGVHKIINLVDPTDPKDASTKSYVDRTALIYETSGFTIDETQRSSVIVCTPTSNMIVAMDDNATGGTFRNGDTISVLLNSAYEITFDQALLANALVVAPILSSIGQYVIFVYNLADTQWEVLYISGGDVVGAASSVLNRIVVFADTTGKVIKDGLKTIAEVLARANHTGTQLASTISNFDTEVANEPSVTANTSARHAQSHTIASHSDNVSTTDIDNDAVTYPKIQNVSATSRMLGRITTGAGDVEELTPAEVRTLIGGEVRPRQFTFINRIPLTSGGSPITGTRPHAQGGDSDSYYIYGSTDTVLNKFLKDSPYTIQAENVSPLTGGTAMTQINGVFAKDDWIYVGANNWVSALTLPHLGYIRRYLKSTLAYVDEFQVGTTAAGTVGYCEGVTWYDGFWWVSYFDENYISKFNSSWVWQADYAVDSGVSGGQGGRWIDNLFYRPITTSGAAPTQQVIQQYVFDGTTFNLLDTIDSATYYANQAMGKEPGTRICYFGECRYDLGTPTNNVVIAELD